ncbi:MAG TPA: hypothetical protein VFQ39_03280 [Longimicrobium sp.]|nr:hypothetical protein [Longimicrobium sp.]
MRLNRALLRPLQNREGMALLFVLLVAAAVLVLALAAVTMAGNANLITLYEERQDEMEAVADGGLELARARLNGTANLFPDTGYVTLENGVTVLDASGTAIPGVKRYTYAGPIGVATGQFGIFGSIVSVAQWQNGDRVVRRGDIVQESFAKYAYFTDVEPASIAFGGGDQISGPVHTNDVLKIYNTRATFRGPGIVTTAKYISGKQYGTFVEGYEENAARIELPETAELDKLRGYAAEGGTAFTAPSGGSANDARIRIEFVSIDLNGDLDAADPDEGFFRVYTSNRADWLMATQPGAGWPSDENCGTPIAGGGTLVPNNVVGNSAAKRNVMKQANSRCYLGGAPELNPGGAFMGVTPGNKGQWLARGFNLSGAPPTALTLRPDYAYLFPLSRRFNPNFKGVVHVTGRVGVSGVLRGRVTLAATDDIFILDDLTYANGPGGGNCADILGLFGASDVRVADNAINAPQQPDGPNTTYYGYDDTGSEFIHAVVLALNQFTADNYDSGATATQPCEATSWGRGCLYLSGGVIQETRGGVGTTNGTGYLKRYAYDACAYSNPPPYFPTTGRFSRSRYYEVDPSGFDVRAFFARWTAG